MQESDQDINEQASDRSYYENQSDPEESEIIE